MDKALVYFIPLTSGLAKDISSAASRLLGKLHSSQDIPESIPLKIHVGEPGNTAYLKPDNFSGIIDFLQIKGKKPYYTETCTVTGARATAKGHASVARTHGFTQIPFFIADGEDGTEETLVEVKNGKHFTKARIAQGLAKVPSVIVLSHFKGHVDAGFGATQKNLGIGFASRFGKIEQHSKDIPYHLKLGTIDWSEDEKLYHHDPFTERVAEYAQAAVRGKKNIYFNFAVSLVENCDCDGEPLEPIYDDLGVCASIDPVAVDAACFDLLRKREGKEPYKGSHIFKYAEKLGLGSPKYSLVELK